MAGPEDWGAVPAAPISGPAAWGAVEAQKSNDVPALGSGNGLLSDIGSEIKNQAMSGLGATVSAFNPLSEENRKINEMHGGFFDPTPVIERGKLLGRGLMGVPAAAFSPVSGPIDAIGGRVIQLLNRGMRAAAVQAFGEDKVRDIEAKQGVAPGLTYEGAKSDLHTLMLGMGPRGGMRPVPAVPTTPPPIPPQADALGVMLSEGQRTGDLALIRREQAAARGQLGPAAEQRATAFREQQGQEVGHAGDEIRQSLDPFGQVVAETPQEAGQVVSQGVQQAAQQSRASVDALYDRARNLPGEIAPETFTGMGTRIRDALSNAAEPVVIDDALTPYASRAIQDIDNRVSRLNIQNRASNTRAMAPGDEPPTIAGVTLTGVDQMRKRLSAFRQQAFGSGNLSDGRAARSVLDAFDTAIDHAVNNGQFTGDARAVQAWNDARAAHADYRQTFGSPSRNKDRVSGVVQKILGNRDNPAAIPNDVADFLYGSSGVNPGSLNVGVANRVRHILGEDSPEWSGVKQGLFSRLTETPPGVTDWGPGQIAQRLNKFLNGDGRELAEAVFSPSERQLLQQYADLHRRLEVPRTGANWSETSTFVAPMFRKITNTLAAMVGGVIGHAVAPGMMGMGEAAGALAAGQGTAALQNIRNARQIARQMPLIAEQMVAYRRALAAYQRPGMPISNRTAAAVTLANLAKSLKPLGIDVYQLAPARADEKQRHRGGRLEAEPDQGEGGKAKRAHGGRVDAANIDHAPTEAQKKAGNYAKDHVHIHGLDITIENAKGATRSGVDRGGKPWSVTMPAHYGYIKGTVGRDKDHVDVYIGPHPRSPHVFVVDQVDADSGRFDEHKAFLGFSSVAQATRAYLAAFSDGKGQTRLGHMAEMPVDAFKRWLDGGDTTKRIEGAEHDHKLSHKAVGYVEQSRIPHKHCSVCTMFREGPHCTLVKDPIEAGGYCRRFAAKE